jgi:RNA polymerase sigma factor (sigma-70 family)
MNMNMNPGISAVQTDEELWRQSRDGDQEAFGLIVERYQGLICALAYSASGRLNGAEDLAQETFLTAWRRIGDLREPGNLRPWLCGIARNLAASAARRSWRRGGEPQSLEAVADPASAADDPARATAGREEEALLWRTLSELPDSYREPLVLFYREHQSVSEVAAQLGLSEDATRQRLSRGRALLREEMMAFVESTLTRTRPGVAFKAGVLAALPLLAAQKAGAATASAKAAVAKAAWGAVLGPLAGLLVGWFSSKALQATARSERERKTLARHAAGAVLGAFGMCAGLVWALSQAGILYPVSRSGLVLGVLAWVAALVALLLAINHLMQRKVRRLRAEDGPEAAPNSGGDAGPGSKPAPPNRGNPGTNL